MQTKFNNCVESLEDTTDFEIFTIMFMDISAMFSTLKTILKQKMPVLALCFLNTKAKHKSLTVSFP